MKKWKTYEDLKVWGITERLKENKGDVRKTAKSLDVAVKTVYNVLGAKKIQRLRREIGG